MFEVDFRKLVRLLLPTMLRRAMLTSLLDAFAGGVEFVYNSFTNSRDAHLYDLEIGPQVYSLQRALNDRFDSLQRRITIGDPVYRYFTYLFIEAEAKRTYLGDIHIFTELEDSAEYDFVVSVPATIVFDEAEMRAVLDKYRLPGKYYTIKII